MPLRKMLSILLLFPSGICFASTQLPRASIAQYERQVWTAATKESEFAAISHTTRSACQATRPPEALATPNPLLDQPNENLKIKVTFIIGTDGRVHSPFILESAGSPEDRIVLDAIRSWRYRPATCNGVPTEAEAKIGFSTR